MERRTSRPEPRCTACGAIWSRGIRCACGGLFDLPDLPAVGIDDLEPGGSAGVWRYGPWIPTGHAVAERLSMGEGGTALIAAGAEMPGVWMKLEFVSPTLSFKDRGAVVLVASAVERGATSLVADSSGNAGSAIAAYAGRAGLPCTVFVPGGTSASKQRQIAAYGATVRVVAGDRSAAGEAARAFVAETGATYASHVYNPMFVQGTKTFAYECWEQLGSAPDAVILPVGNGTLVLGAARGFRELHAAGVIDRVPPVVALQSERCAPLALAWALGSDEPARVTAGLRTAAEGIAIPSPPRGAQILREVRSTGGMVLSVPEAAIGPAANDLAGRGLYVEPTAALTWAGALLLRDSSLPSAPPGDRRAWERAARLCSGTVVVPLCGSGLNSAG